MNKQALIYSLKVWLTTIILGIRITGLIKLFIDPLIYKFEDIFSSAIYDIPVGLIACAPSFFIFLFAVRRICKRNTSVLLKKAILSAIGILLSLIPFIILFPYQLFHTNYLPDMLPELCSYVGLTLVGIWVYKLPQNTLLPS